MASIRTATAPNLIGQPDNKLFKQNDFEAFAWQKGYKVVFEQAIACPCRGTSGEAKPTCKNCLGLGWVFINPTNTRALITNINKDTKFKYWSPELIGTIAVTVQNENKLSYMDKITMTGKTSIISEVKPVLENDGQKFIFCSYKVESINEVFLYAGDDVKLTRITDLCSIKSENGYVVLLDDSIEYSDNYNGVVSIDYEHEVSYNVIDIPHEIRTSFIINSKGQRDEYEMPMQAIARRSHLSLGDSTNFDGDNVIDNSYDE
jgi:hypothetical protein